MGVEDTAKKDILEPGTPMLDLESGELLLLTPEVLCLLAQNLRMNESAECTIAQHIVWPVRAPISRLPEVYSGKRGSGNWEIGTARLGPQGTGTLFYGDPCAPLAFPDSSPFTILLEALPPQQEHHLHPGHPGLGHLPHRTGSAHPGAPHCPARRAAGRWGRPLLFIPESMDRSC